MVIKVNPANLCNAASGMERYTASELKSLGDRLQNSYLLVGPGMGIALSAIEGYYNQVCAYHSENLTAGVAAVESVAAGLRQTASNCQAAEQVNYTGLTGETTSSDVVSFGDAFMRIDAEPESPSGLEEFGKMVDCTVMGGCVALAALCSGISWPFAVVPALAALMVANLPSIFSTATDLEEIASNIDNPTLSGFRTFAAAAVAGWEDLSRPDYEHTVAELAAEISQVKEALIAAAAFLRSIGTALVGFWVALVAFLPAFFAALAAVATTGVGIPAAEAMGVVAAGAWVGVFTKVIGVIGICATLTGAVMSAASGLKKFDVQRDDIPDLKQIKIRWASS